MLLVSYFTLRKMVVNIECALNELHFDEKMTTVFNTYNKYINYRFDYVIRTSIKDVSPELEFDVDREYKTEATFINFSVSHYLSIFVLKYPNKKPTHKLFNYVSSLFLFNYSFLFFVHKYLIMFSIIW